VVQEPAINGTPERGSDRFSWLRRHFKVLNPLQFAESHILQAGGERTLANKLLTTFLTWLGDQ
jgi:hypothetical protein